MTLRDLQEIISCIKTLPTDSNKIKNFNDPIAEKISWESNSFFWSNFISYTLTISDGILTYVLSKKSKIKMMVIILILGSFEIIQIGVAFNEKVFVNFLNVLNIDFFIFILSIIYFIYATKNKKIFDKMIGIYYTGKLPNFTEENKANISHLSQIYALQII